jgi:hypothetical protein
MLRKYYPKDLLIEILIDKDYSNIIKNGIIKILNIIYIE